MRRYVGPAAKGARKAATVTPQDLLDLLEPVVWVGFHSRSDIHLIGPALAAYFGLCGATPVEATRATRGSFRPSGSDRVLLPGLIKGVQPRIVPLLAIAKLRLQAYVSATSYTSDADALFKDNNGAPIGLESIYGYFSQLGNRIGLAGGELPRILREAFLRWLDHCPTEDTRSYLSGKSLFGAQFSAAPDFREAKAELELALEPLANLDRQGLRQGGAVARSFPSPYFPTLSRDGLSDLAAVRNGNGTLPLEVLRAIQIALRSGKSMLEVSDHYRLSRATIYSYVRNGFPHKRIPTLTNPSTGRAIVKHVQSHPQCYSTELTTWVNATFGTNASRSYVSRLTRNLGLKLAPHPYWSIQKEAVDQSWGLVKAAIQHDPMLSNSEIVEIIENETGVALALTNVAKHLSRRPDLPPRAARRGQQFRGPGNEWSFSETFERIWPTLRQEMLRDPSLADRELCDIIEGETGTRLSRAMLATHLDTREDLPPRTATAMRGSRVREYGKKRQALNDAWPRIRDELARDPTLSDLEIKNVLIDETGVSVSEPTIIKYLASRPDLPKRALLRGAKHRAPGNSFAGNLAGAFDAAWPAVKAELQREPSLSARDIIQIVQRETGIVMTNVSLSKYMNLKTDVPHRNKRRGPRYRVAEQHSSILEPDVAFGQAWGTVRQRMSDDPTLSDPEIAGIVEESTRTRVSGHIVRSNLARRSDVPFRSASRGRRARIGGRSLNTIEPAAAFEQAWPVVRARLLEDPTLSDPEIARIIERETSNRISPRTAGKCVALKQDAPVRSAKRGPRFREKQASLSKAAPEA